MHVNDLLRKTHSNFRLICKARTISRDTLKKKDWRGCAKLKIKPRKITAYFRKDLIAEVYKAVGMRADKEFYLIRAVDDTLFHVTY